LKEKSLIGEIKERALRFTKIKNASVVDWRSL